MTRRGVCVSFEDLGTRLVLSMPHSGINTPYLCSDKLRDSENVRKTLNMGVDVCVPLITGFDEQKFSKIKFEGYRALLDVNREVKNVDGYSVEGKDKGDLQPHGLIWRSSVAERPEDIEEMLIRPYTEEEFKDLLNDCYYPYIDSVNSLVRKSSKDHSNVILLDLHSFPPYMPMTVQEGLHKGAYLASTAAKRGRFSLQEKTMPDVILIDNVGQSCDPRVSQTVIDVFTQSDYLIERIPFGPLKGDKGSVAMYADPKGGVHAVALEFIAHDIEVNRAAGILEFNEEKARNLRPVYDELFRRLNELEL